MRFEAAWRAGGHPPIEPYLAGVPEPERSALLQELLLLDVDYRLRGGQTPRSDEYRTAFPAQRHIVEDVFRQSGLADAVRPAGARRFGDYELLEEIARGGMGVVYRARQISPDRIVALKMILAGNLASEAEVERFQREAEAAAGLQHPNIIAIHEVGRHEGQHYFTMDFVAGKNLAQWIRETPLPIRQAAECLQTLALAIDYAHQRKTVHRDLKPSNILIDESGQPRITDFGLAKRVRADPDLTGSGQVLGTPGYMPPEQATGRLAEIGPASDIYALGAILYEVLAGRPPFCADGAADVLLQVLHVEPASPRLLNPQIPVDLETVCLKCLEKAPSARYLTAAALADDLGRFLRGEPIRARPAGWLRRGGKWCRRNPAVAALTAGLMLTLALLAGSSIAAAWHLRSQRDAALAAHAWAEQAERNATDKLWEAYLAQAGRPGGAGWRANASRVCKPCRPPRPFAFPWNSATRPSPAWPCSTPGPSGNGSSRASASPSIPSWNAMPRTPPAARSTCGPRQTAAGCSPCPAPATASSKGSASVPADGCWQRPTSGKTARRRANAGSGTWRSRRSFSRRPWWRVSRQPRSVLTAASWRSSPPNGRSAFTN